MRSNLGFVYNAHKILCYAIYSSTLRNATTAARVRDPCRYAEFNLGSDTVEQSMISGGSNDERLTDDGVAYVDVRRTASREARYSATLRNNCVYLASRRCCLQNHVQLTHGWVTPPPRHTTHNVDSACEGGAPSFKQDVITSPINSSCLLLKRTSITEGRRRLQAFKSARKVNSTSRFPRI